MKKYIGLLVITLFFSQHLLSQEITGAHEVVKGSQPNEYNIKTTISGLQGVDIARIKYLIDTTHTYIASPSNGFFSDRNEKYIKFYIMAVPATGEINIELGVKVANGGEFAFQVEFQYSKNEAKKTVELPRVYLTTEGPVLTEEVIPVVVEPESISSPEEVVEEIVEVADVSEEDEVVVEPSEIAETSMPIIPVEETVVETVEEEIVEEVTEVEEKTVEPNETIEVEAPITEEIPEPTEIVEDVLVVEESPEISVEVVPENSIDSKPEIIEVSEDPAPVVEEVLEVEVEEKIEEVKETAEVKNSIIEEIVEPGAIMEDVPVVEKALDVADEIVETPEVITKEVVEEKSTIIAIPASNTKYTVQLLSLSKFSQERLDYYCKKHNLIVSKVKKKQSGEWMKITYDELNSMEEAKQLNQELSQSHGITDAFVVAVK